MLAEFIDKIAKLGRDSQAAEVVKVEGVERKSWLHTPGGELEEIEIPPEDRSHELYGFSDIVAAAKDGGMTKAAEIYHGHELGVFLYLDRADRRERARLRLEPTKRFNRLVKLMEPASFSVRDAVKLLRFELHGLGAEAVLQALSRIDFQRRNSGTAAAAHGKESLGRAVEAEAQNAKDIPDEFKVECPIYSNQGFRHHTALVRCGVYLDVQNEQVEIRVLADELEGALMGAQKAIGDELRTALPGVPVFHGAP